jgi:hypothetical protein
MELSSVIRRWRHRDSFSFPGDIAAHRSVEENGPQVPARRQCGGPVQRARAREQARSVCRQAAVHARAGGRQIPQAEANDPAVSAEAN